MGYGIKMVFDMVWDFVSGSTSALGGILGAFAAATEQAMQGNFRAAASVLLGGASDSVDKLKGIGTRITEDAKKNLKAMQLAQGLFNRDMSPAGMPGSAQKDGKPWEPAPEVEAEDDGSFLKSQQAAHEAYIRYLHAFDERKASEIKSSAAEAMEINKQGYESGLIDLKTYLETKHKYNQAALQAELAAKQSELITARQAEKDARAAFDADSSGDSAKVVNDAYARTEAAIKAVTEAQSKLTLAKLTDSEETKKSLKTEIEDRIKIEAATSEAAIQIAKIQGFETSILEANKAVQDSKNKILLLESSIGNIKAAELAVTLQQIAAEKMKTKELEIQAELSLRKGILNGTISGLTGGYNSQGQWEYTASQRYSVANPYISDSSLMNGGGGNNSSVNSAATNNFNVTVQGGADAAQTGYNIAQAVRNGITAYQFNMIPNGGGFLP
jgi:hypothetical protein